jgi:hypothetical protein
MSRSLDAAERWMVAAITSGRGPAEARLADTAISAEAGLAIYRHAYRARLVECLADDFAALRALLGGEAFERLALAVVAACPSDEPTLNRYGRRLVAHLHRDPGATALGTAARDLARLEWALVEAIHAPLAPPLDPSALAAIPPRRWSRARLVAAPSLRLITSRWAIDGIYRQHLRGERPTVASPDPETVAVVRRADGLHRLPLIARRGRLLNALARGRPLAEALAACRLPPADVQDTLAHIVAAGCFTAVTLEHP